MTTTAKPTKAEQRKAERIIERQAYIENAKVDLRYLRKGIAVVTSEFDADKEYNVEVIEGRAVSCGCDDYFWTIKKHPGLEGTYQCKHCLAAEKALTAKPAKPAKAPRRSAVNQALIAEYHARYDETVTTLVAAMLTPCPRNAHKTPDMSTTCQGNVTDLSKNILDKVAA